MALGVTSTYSSSPIYSMHSSRENFIAGVIEALMSALAALTFDLYLLIFTIPVLKKMTGETHILIYIKVFIAFKVAVAGCA